MKALKSDLAKKILKAAFLNKKLAHDISYQIPFFFENKKYKIIPHLKNIKKEP